MGMSGKGREREGEAGESGVGGLGSDGGGSVLGFVSDHMGHSFRSRDTSVTISLATGFARRHGKVLVERKGKSHFIFLDEDQLLWLQDVLTVAARGGWMLPRNCVRSSFRRRVVVEDFWSRGTRFLCVRESCRDGKSFFVVIPMDLLSGGWNLLLGELRKFSSEVFFAGVGPIARSSGRESARSYAQVVAGPKLAMTGACKVLRSPHIEKEEAGAVVLEVGEEGVAQREAWLSHGVVLRLDRESGLAPDWGGFRRWAARCWGIPLDVEVRRLGDDLWLLVLSSAEEVGRVIRLRKWDCPGHKVVVDKWVPAAGTSEVIEKRGGSWFKVSGIPIHLRSEAVFVSIAQCFGERAVAEDFDCTLNEIRIRACSSEVNPGQIRLRFKDASFELKVLKLSGGSPVAMCDKGVSSMAPATRQAADRSAGTAIEGMSSDVQAVVLTDVRVPSVGAEASVEVVGVGEVSEEGNSAITLVLGSGEVGVGTEEGSSAITLVLGSGDVGEGTKKRAEHVLSPSILILDGELGGTGEKGGQGKDLGGSGLVFNQDLGGLELVEGGKLVGLKPSVGLEVFGGPGLSASDQPTPLGDFSERNVVDLDKELPQSPDASGADEVRSASTPSSLTRSIELSPVVAVTVSLEGEVVRADEEAIVEKCGEMVDVLKVDIGGSREEARKIVMEVANGMLARRKKSRSERELQRLAWQGGSVEPGSTGKKSGSGPSSSSNDYA
ncbi:hypothetical protein LINPERPRIM_LOCUS3990 [Linum perenne]